MGQNNALNTTLSGQTGTGAFVGNNAGLLINPVLDAAVATSLSFTTTSGIIGTTTNNAAAAGSVGELMSSIVLLGSAVCLTSGSTSNITSLLLTAGDWDCWGSVWAAPAASTLQTQVTFGISQTSVTLPTVPALGTSIVQLSGFTIAAGNGQVLGVPQT